MQNHVHRIAGRDQYYLLTDCKYLHIHRYNDPEKRKVLYVLGGSLGFVLLIGALFAIPIVLVVKLNSGTTTTTTTLAATATTTGEINHYQLCEYALLVFIVASNATTSSSANTTASSTSNTTAATVTVCLFV